MPQVSPRPVTSQSFPPYQSPSTSVDTDGCGTTNKLAHHTPSTVCNSPGGSAFGFLARRLQCRKLYDQLLRTARMALDQKSKVVYRHAPSSCPSSLSAISSKCCSRVYIPIKAPTPGVPTDSSLGDGVRFGVLQTTFTENLKETMLYNAGTAQLDPQFDKAPEIVGTPVPRTRNVDVVRDAPCRPLVTRRCRRQPHLRFAWC